MSFSDSPVKGSLALLVVKTLLLLRTTPRVGAPTRPRWRKMPAERLVSRLAYHSSDRFWLTLVCGFRAGLPRVPVQRWSPGLPSGSLGSSSMIWLLEHTTVVPPEGSSLDTGG